MTFLARLAVVTLATYGLAAGVASFGVPRLWRRDARVSAYWRAVDTFWWRLAPCAAGLTVTLFAIIAFLRYEPRTDGETTGIAMDGVAALSTALIALCFEQSLSTWWRTRRLLQRWLPRAERISLPGMSIPCYAVECEFPVVAIVGALRPRLLIARSVLRECPEAELTVVLAHERAHISRRDNLRQLLFGAAPDLLTPGARREMSAAWQSAVEEAADDAAVGTDDGASVLLASALVRVARLAPSAHLADLPASALYRGEPLESRVRRLLDRSGTEKTPSRIRPWHIAIVAGLLVAAVCSLGIIQDLVEAAVRFLP